MPKKCVLSQCLNRKSELEFGIRQGWSHAELASQLNVSHGTLSRLLLHFWKKNLTEIRVAWKIALKK